MNFTNLFIFILLITAVSCKKRETLSGFTSFTINENTPINKITFINDSVGFACGGKRNIEGFIYKTVDKGVSWQQIYSSEYSRCLYDITFLNDSVGYAGGDYTYFIKTIDGGNSWNIYWFKDAELSFHEKFRPDIKNITFLSDSVGYFVGGENYSEGAFYKTFDGGMSWSFDTLHHELNAITFGNNVGYFSGFGYVGKISNGLNYEEVEFKGGYYPAIEYLDDDSFILISSNGAIYKSIGDKWNRIKVNNSSISHRKILNEVFFYDNNGYIIGNNGIIYSSTDYGNSWTLSSTKEKENLTTITKTSEYIFIGKSDGKILRKKI